MARLTIRLKIHKLHTHLPILGVCAELTSVTLIIDPAARDVTLQREHVTISAQMKMKWTLN